MSQETEERIVRAFLKLAAERGIDRTTTREVADAAGVNEVTIFRRFGDKERLARAAIQYFHPGRDFEAYPLEIDASSSDAAAAGITRVMVFIRDRLRDRSELLQFGLGEATRFPALLELVHEGPLTGLRLLRRALERAAPRLRPEVDIEASVMSLLGLVLLTTIWTSRGWLRLDEPQWDGLFHNAVRPLVRVDHG
ncbi:helix-turn-helix domain-containing protein [Candidatus Nephthysia bennettiae]|uniref:TetR/AcrR family transcriptional regulator n=1 Tax=Candidatus Nephthysia bennettiae TaxID=3127016 RepID=UPI0030C6756E